MLITYFMLGDLLNRGICHGYIHSGQILPKMCR